MGGGGQYQEKLERRLGRGTKGVSEGTGEERSRINKSVLFENAE